MVRVRNEEEKISYCLRSILGVFDEIVVVDNGSDDGTASSVREIRRSVDGGDRIRTYSYPHRLARFGPEHAETPEDSVHSAVYYTNWAISRCSYRYICKWDGDMVLRSAAREPFIDLVGSIGSARNKCWVLAGQTVYRGVRGSFYLAKDEVNREVEIFPNSVTCRFEKHPHWERLRRPFYVRKAEFEPVCFFELKYVDENEFDHWSTAEWPSERKRREWENFNLVREGRTDSDRFERLPASWLDEEVR